MHYAKKYSLGIVVLTDEAHLQSLPAGANGAWLKFLAPKITFDMFPSLNRLALLDTDIIINPGAPNIFGACPPGEIGVVSQVKNLPFDLTTVRKRMAFLRHTFYSSRYPLDSSLFASAEQEYSNEGLPAHDDLFCSGLVVVDQAHSNLFAGWLQEVSAERVAGATAWEQTFLNHKVISHGCYWLDYKFQAIWNFEMASQHQSLYRHQSLEQNRYASIAVADTLSSCFFLHFAGSWGESDAWKNPPSLCQELLEELSGDEFLGYLERPSTGVSTGLVVPE